MAATAFLPGSANSLGSFYGMAADPGGAAPCAAMMGSPTPPAPARGGAPAVATLAPQAFGPEAGDPRMLAPSYAEEYRLEPEYYERVVEVPKIQIENRERLIEVPQPQIVDRIVEIPQVQEVVREIPGEIETHVITREVPRIEVRQVERIVEVPQIEYQDRYVEVEEVREVVRRIPRVEVHEIPVERVIRVPKKVVQEIEQPVYRPVPHLVQQRVEREIPVARTQVQTVEVVRQVPVQSQGGPGGASFVAAQPPIEAVMAPPAGQPMQQPYPQQAPPQPAQMQYLQACASTGPSPPQSLAQGMPVEPYPQQGPPQPAQMQYLQACASTGPSPPQPLAQGMSAARMQSYSVQAPAAAASRVGYGGAGTPPTPPQSFPALGGVAMGSAVLQGQAAGTAPTAGQMVYVAPPRYVDQHMTVPLSSQAALGTGGSLDGNTVDVRSFQQMSMRQGFNPFASTAVPPSVAAVAEATRPAQSMSLFDALDRDGDGFITRDELQQALASGNVVSGTNQLAPQSVQSVHPMGSACMAPPMMEPQTPVPLTGGGSMPSYAGAPAAGGVYGMPLTQQGQVPQSMVQMQPPPSQYLAASTASMPAAGSLQSFQSSFQAGPTGSSFAVPMPAGPTGSSFAVPMPAGQQTPPTPPAPSAGVRSSRPVAVVS